jgi:spermidine synthase
MGGMALGAWLTARIVHRLKNLLLIYALVEAIIGLCGLGFHTVFTSLQAISYDYIFPSLESSFAVQSYKWSLATLLIIPQSILLGTTFPLMSNALIRLFPDRTGYSLSVLYFVNSLGAFIGVLVSGFFLISKAGLPGTIMTAAVLNICIAVLIYPVAKKQTSRFAPEPQKNYHHPYPLLILIAAFITGTASFIYEIAWLRLLSICPHDPVWNNRLLYMFSA